jgi:hypothetical protein
VAVLAGVRDAAEASRLAGSVLAQRLRPYEVVVWLTGDGAPADGTRATRQAVASALGRLGAAGVTAAVVPGRGLAAAARTATAAWSAPWDPAAAYPPSYLLELVCALECSRADAAGRADVGDYVFTTALDPLVARTALYRDGGPPPHTWARRGLRLFAVDLAQEGS